jgi:Tol biopolymer transport system component
MPGDRDESDPDWSQDGNLLVFGGFSWVEGGADAIRLWDRRTKQVSILPGSKGLYNPRWSPNERYILATAIGDRKLLLFDFASQKWADLAEFTVNLSFKDWSRDGKYLYASTLFERDSALFRIRISDGKQEQLINLKNIRQAVGSFGPWTGLTPDDSPLLVRDVGTQEIYVLDWEAP